MRPGSDHLLACPRAWEPHKLRLVALILALRQCPPSVRTDLQAALSTLRGWGMWPLARVLACADQSEVREAPQTASLVASPVRLKKVKAHGDIALAAGWPKAVGNHLTDCWMKQAALDPAGALWAADRGRFGDPVELLNASGSTTLDVSTTLRRA